MFIRRPMPIYCCQWGILSYYTRKKNNAKVDSSVITKGRKRRKLATLESKNKMIREGSCLDVGTKTTGNDTFYDGSTTYTCRCPLVSILKGIDKGNPQLDLYNSLYIHV